MGDQENTRERIKAAATEVFVERGYDGARMQEIADRAGANKAMIYYYWASKEALFAAILGENMGHLFKMLGATFEDDLLDAETVITRLVHTHLHFLQEHAHLPRLLVREMHSGNPVVEKLIRRNMGKLAQGYIGKFGERMKHLMEAGAIRPMDPRQILMNVAALNLFTFIMQPLLAIMWGEELPENDRLLQEREQAVVELLLHGLLPR